MAPQHEPDAEGTESPEAVALFQTLVEFKDLVDRIVADGNEEDVNFVFVDATDSFGGLPAELGSAANKVGKAWGDYDGPITTRLAALLDQAAAALQYGIRAQHKGCTAYHADGQKCPSRVSGDRNILFNLCRRHIADFRLFASWLDVNWRPVKLECHCCSAAPEDGELPKMRCFTCGRGMHTVCLRRAVNKVEPGKLSLQFGDKDSEFFVCAQCVCSDYARVLLEAEFIKGQIPEAVFVVNPISLPADVFVEEDFTRFLRDKRRGSVPEHFLVAIKPERPRQAVNEEVVDRQPRRRFRGGSSIILGEDEIPARRVEQTGQEASSAGLAGRGQVGRTASTAGGTRLENLRQLGGQERTREEDYEYFKERLGRDGILHRTPPSGAGYEHPITERFVQGEQFGAKSGQAGSFDCTYAHAVECYHGQGEAQGSVHAKKVTLVLGCSSVSSQPQTYDPESKVRQRGFKLEDGQMVAVEASSLATPLQHTWVTYVDGAIRLWTRVANSGFGVFNPEHEHHEYHMAVAHLIVLRYFYLLELAKKLQQGRQAVHWEVAWRYITAFIAENFTGVLALDSSLDLQLLNISEEDGYRRDIKVAAAIKIDHYLLCTAKEAALAAANRSTGSGGDRAVTQADLESTIVRVLSTWANGARLGGAGGTAGGGDGARSGTAGATTSKKKCPLCLSAEHVYHAGNYGHKEGMKITQACTKVMSDGAPCGLRHAFTGPLQSPCRMAGGADRA